MTETVPDSTNSGEVLDQKEVDALVASAVKESQAGKGGAVQPYSFNTPSFLTPGKLRRVRIRHEEFANNLASSVSQFLRSDFGVRLAKLETVSHKTLVDTLAGPTNLVLIRLDPLPGMGLLELTPRLALTVVSRLLGGKGQIPKEDRSLTVIEQSLINGFFEIVLREYMLSWEMREPQVKIVLVEHETSARYLKLAPDHTTVLLVTLEVTFGEATGMIRMALLYSTLEPLIKKFVEQIPIDTQPTQPPPKINLAIDGSKFDIPISVRACWDGLQITLDDLARLQCNDVLLLDPSVTQQAKLYLGQVGHFMGQVVRKGERVAVRITSKVKS